MNDLLGDTAGDRVSDLESGPSSSSASGIRAAHGRNLKPFFREVYNVTSSMAEILEKLLMLQKSSEDYRNVTSATAMKVIKENMDEDLDEICVLAGDLRGKLEALDRSNAANREIMNCQAGSSTDRQRMRITSDVKRRLRELTVDFQVLGQRFQDGFREMVGTRLLTATGQQVDESMIEHLIETGDSEPIFRSAILMIERLIETGDTEPVFQDAILTHGRGEVLDMIAEIQERHHTVKDIEKKLLELHQIFPDLGVVVEAQDEFPDNIELEVDLSVVNAFDHYGKCLCISILVLVFVAVILVVAVTGMDTK